MPEPSRDRWIAITATLVALAPVIVTVITRSGRRYLPTGDSAVLDLRVRDVWSRNVPLVGAYSRFGWNHPGPAMYWLLAPLSAAAGRAAWATQVGSALLQGGAIALTAWVAWKIRGLPLVLGALAVQALAYGSTGTWILLEPWNPNVAFPFLPLFALLVWAIGLGETRWLPLAVFAGTFLVQTHVGYAPIVAAGAVWIVACATLDVRHDRARLAPWRGRALAWSAVVAAVMWLPVVVQQVAKGSQGNLTRLARYFVLGRGSESALGLHRGAGILAVEFRVLPPWLGGSTPTEPLLRNALGVSLLWLVVPGALVIVGLYAASRAAAREAMHAVGLSAVLCAVGLVSLARVRGDANNYLFYWRSTLAIMLVAAAITAVGACLRAHARWRVAASTALFLVVAVPSTALAVDVARAPHHEQIAPTAAQFLDAIERRGLPKQRILVRHAGSALRGLEGALIDELDRRGVPVRVDTDRGYQFGDRRGARPDQVDQVWYAVESGVYTTLLSEAPGAEVIAATTPLSPDQERELRSLQRQLAAQLRAAGRPDLLDKLDSSLVSLALAGVPGLDAQSVGRLGQLNQVVERSGACRCSAVAFPAASAPAEAAYPAS